jgi:hypothetical protein
MKWWRCGFGALLGIALLGGCGDGGQTGQPTAASGCWKPVALDTPIEGVSGRKLLDAFIGKYSATLHWQGDAGARADEDIEIEIAPTPDGIANEGSSYPCTRVLIVPVAATLTFADGSVLSSNGAGLSAGYGSLDATLSFSSTQWSVNAMLRSTVEGKSIAGRLESAEDGSLAAELSGNGAAAGSGGQ